MKSRIIFLGGLVLTLTACGADSSDDTSGGSTPQTGVFVDSQVINIGYRTNTLSGVTDNLGQYEYIEGETVTFFIGDMDFPPVPAAAVVTPLDMADTQDTNDSTVINIIRLLQTLDKDANPDNGITITETAGAAAGQVDFELPVADFEALPEAINLIGNAGQDVAVSELVAVADAIFHFETTLTETPLSTGSAVDIPVKEISVDGSSEEWNGVQPIALDETDTQSSSTNITRLSVASDGDMFYMLIESAGDFAFPHTAAAEYSHYDAFVRFHDDSDCENEENGYISVGNFTDSIGGNYHRLRGFFNDGTLADEENQPTNTASEGAVLETSFRLSMLPRDKGNYFTLNAIVSSVAPGQEPSEYDRLTADVCFNLPAL